MDRLEGEEKKNLEALGKAVVGIRILLHTFLGEEPVAHYTSRSVLEGIGRGQPFRLYNIKYVTDTQEGDVLFNEEYLGKETKESFYDDESPQDNHVYIGSFVSGEGCEDELPFWQSRYGNDGYGCSLLFRQDVFKDIAESAVYHTIPQGDDKQEQPPPPTEADEESKRDFVERQSLCRVFYGKEDKKYAEIKGHIEDARESLEGICEWLKDNKRRC